MPVCLKAEGTFWETGQGWGQQAEEQAPSMHGREVGRTGRRNRLGASCWCSTTAASASSRQTLSRDGWSPGILGLRPAPLGTSVAAVWDPKSAQFFCWGCQAGQFLGVPRRQFNPEQVLQHSNTCTTETCFAQSKCYARAINTPNRMSFMRTLGASFRNYLHDLEAKLGSPSGQEKHRPSFWLLRITGAGE